MGHEVEQQIQVLSYISVFRICTVLVQLVPIVHEHLEWALELKGGREIRRHSGVRLDHMSESLEEMRRVDLKGDRFQLAFFAERTSNHERVGGVLVADAQFAKGLEDRP